MHLAIICGVLDAQRPIGAQTIALVNDLVERDYHVSLFALSGVVDELDPRVDLIVAGSTPRRTWLAMLRYPRWVNQALANARPDCTISLLSTVPAMIMVPMTGTMRSRSRIKRSLRPGVLGQLIERLNDLQPWVASAQLLERRAMSSDTVQAFIAISPLIKTHLQADRPERELSIELASISQPTQMIRAEQALQLRGQLARAWGISGDSYWVVFPFVDAELDGFETLLRAVKPLIEQGVDAVVQLAGPTRYTHLAWIGQLRLRDRVRFVGETGMLQELMAASDLIVCPTSHDPSGWALRTALGHGKPIVTTTASGVAEDVSAAGGSVLSCPAQPVALLEAIREQHARWVRGGAVEKAPESPHEPPLAQVIDRWVQRQNEPA